MIYKPEKTNFEPKFLEKHAKIKDFKFFFGKSRKNFTSPKVGKNFGIASAVSK